MKIEMSVSSDTLEAPNTFGQWVPFTNFEDSLGQVIWHAFADEKITSLEMKFNQGTTAIWRRTNNVNAV